MSDQIQIGDQAFVSDGGEEFGAVRHVDHEAVVVYVENAGDFRIPRAAVSAVHAQKVVFDCAQLDARLRRAIGHAKPERRGADRVTTVPPGALPRRGRRPSLAACA